MQGNKQREANETMSLKFREENILGKRSEWCDKIIWEGGENKTVSDWLCLAAFNTHYIYYTETIELFMGN